MPIYEYKCKKCGKITEKIFPINENIDHIVCECNYMATKIISKTGIFDIKGYSEKNGYAKGDK
jgi:putative FmdB family regulatory protein